MQQHKCVEDYLNSVVPTNIPDSKRAELRDEMECHIYDKAEFYMEIGYSEEDSFSKAVEEMGEAQGVKTEFEAIYKDSAIKGVLWFIGICAVNLLSVISGCGYFFLEHNYSTELPNFLQLFLLLCFFVILITHTIKCCRYKLHKQLKGITYAFALASACSVITSGIFFPIVYAAPFVLSYITNKSVPDDYSVGFLINMIMLFAYTLVCFLSLQRDYRYRKKPYRLSLKIISVILSVISICFLLVYIPAYTKFEYPYMQTSWYEQENAESEFLSSITTEQFKSYNSIELGDDSTHVLKQLKEKGFSDENTAYEADASNKELDEFLNELFPENESEQGIEKYIVSGFIPYDIETYLLSRLVKNIGTNKYTSYYYNIKGDDEDAYDNIVSCILISYNDNGEIDYKLYFPDLESDISDTYYQSKTHGEATLKWFDCLKKGDSTASVLEFIRNTGALIIEDEKRVGESTVSKYKIYLQCYYPLKTDFYDLILGNPPEDISHSFELDIEAENGKITSGIMKYYYNDDTGRTINGKREIG